MITHEKLFQLSAMLHAIRNIDEILIKLKKDDIVKNVMFKEKSASFANAIKTERVIIAELYKKLNPLSSDDIFNMDVDKFISVVDSDDVRRNKLLIEYDIKASIYRLFKVLYEINVITVDLTPNNDISLENINIMKNMLIHKLEESWKTDFDSIKDNGNSLFDVLMIVNNRTESLLLLITKLSKIVKVFDGMGDYNVFKR